MNDQRCEDTDEVRTEGHKGDRDRTPGSVVDQGDRHDKGEQSLCVGEAA
jgi:hypothetical protein